MHAADAAPRRSRKTLAWLLATQALAAASLVPWFTVAGQSVMALDAPDSAAQVAPWVFVVVVWSYPLLPAVCAMAAWRAFARRRWRRAAVLTAIPLLPALPLLAYLLWVSAPA